MNIRRFFDKNSHETLTMIPKELGVELPKAMGKLTISLNLLEAK